MKNFRILLAEDDSGLREIFCELISGEGYSCTMVKDGEDARQSMKENQYDLLICDLQMPHLGGADLLMWMRSTGIHIPVIFLTGKDSCTEEETYVMKDCCTTLLYKPLSLEVLLGEIQKSKERKHEFDCRGQTYSPALGEKPMYPGQHFFPNQL